MRGGFGEKKEEEVERSESPRCGQDSRWRGHNAHMRNNRLRNCRMQKNACTVRSPARGEACMRGFSDMSHLSVSYS